MDFSYFTSPQPYQFFALPPTPSQSNTPPSGDYRPVLSTVRMSDDASSVLPSNTPPQQEQFDAAFAAFQQNFRYDPSAFVSQQRPSLSRSPTKSTRKDSTMSDGNGHGLQPIAADMTHEEQMRRSSSEEKETLTPAQSRRKAQNRAAQRAFRERKEKHVKELEAKLTTLEHQSVSLSGENERLKRELAKIATENEILRATSGGGGSGPHPFADDSDEITSTGPLHYSPRDFFSKLDLSENKDDYRDKKYIASHRITVSADSGERLLAAGATWDYIQQHELFLKGLVDVGDVCERLKKLARCDGQGPVFEERDVRTAINESAVAGGRDELI